MKQELNYPVPTSLEISKKTFLEVIYITDIIRKLDLNLKFFQGINAGEFGLTVY
jgi:hypothetical protein